MALHSAVNASLERVSQLSHLYDRRQQFELFIWLILHGLILLTG